MHVLPRVRELEQRFADSLTVIGVHAGKFITERVTARIAEACDRLGVHHAVVNDRQFRVWRDYAVSAWPTLIAIDPEGYLAFIAPGELPVTTLAEEITRIAARAEKRGTLVRGADPTLPLVAAPAHSPGILRFPTRAVLTGEHLWVADTGNGRVVKAAWNPDERAATVIAEYGGFAEPRGLALVEGSMYVADRAGHSVWRLGGEGRERVAGTGVLGEGRIRSGSALETELRSPWGLSAYGDGLVIAMAGTHQLWTFAPVTGALSLLAGRGGEDIEDGPLRGALLAQPSGVSVMSGTGLVFADAESSAVRVAGSDTIATLVGTGLFEFGDRVGRGDQALLQHCEDVTVHGNALAVADTYNDRLKRVDPVSRECAPWPGEAGSHGALREPGGVSGDGSVLLVADTGNHRVTVVEDDGALTEVRFV